MTHTAESIAGLIKEKLQHEFGIERIVLFGSRATGTADNDSDWDFLVIGQSDTPFYERQGKALHMLGPRDFSMDLLVFTPEECARGEEMLGSAIYWAQREGKVMYAK